MELSNLPVNQLVLSVFAATGVIANLFSLSSCRLMEFEGGSMGLYKYAYDGFDQCQSFGHGIEDEGFKVARVASVSSVGFGMCLLAWNNINLFMPQRVGPSQEIIAMLLGGAAQVCLSMVYVARQNEICEVFNCTWGPSILWNLIAHIMYLAASSSSGIFVRAPKRDSEHRRKRKKRQMMMP